MRILIIGLGGIGSALVNKLCRFIRYRGAYIDIENIVLVDGDKYEIKNMERQEFSFMENLINKAEVKKAELENLYEFNNILSIPEYVREENISDIIKENDFIFLCVDNHKTRKLVSDYCGNMHEVVLISGGNEWSDGNVQIYIRSNEEDITPKLTDYHPEIQNPKDLSPHEMSCEQLAHSEPQLYFANLSVATFMCWAFYNIINNMNTKVSEIYFDMNNMAVDAKVRKTKS